MQRLVHYSGYYSKVARVLFSVWFSIQGIIQNTTCSVWFRIQRIIKKYPVFYSASDSLFRVLFKIRPAAFGSLFKGLFKIRPAASGSGFRVLFNTRPAASDSGFRVLFKSGQGIVHSMVHYSGYYSKYDLQRLVQDSAYYPKISRVLICV